MGTLQADDLEPIQETSPKSTSRILQADDLEAEQSSSSLPADDLEPVKDSGFFEGVRTFASNMKQKIEQIGAQRQQAEQAAQAEKAAQDANPANWSSTRYKKEAPKPQTPEEQAAFDNIVKIKEQNEEDLRNQTPPPDISNWSSDRFAKEAPKPRTLEEQVTYNSILEQKKRNEKALTSRVLGDTIKETGKDIFDRPGAANREAIRESPLKAALGPFANLTGGEAAKRGAENPEESEKFQDQLLRKVNEGLSPEIAKKLSGSIGPITGFLSDQDKEEVGRFIAGAPASTLGLVADIATNPAEILLTILGERGLKYVSKITISGRTLAERATGELKDILKPAGKAVESALKPTLPVSDIYSASPEIPAPARETGLELKPSGVVDAEIKRSSRLMKNRGQTVSMLEEKIYSGDEIPKNIPEEWLNEAKTRVLRRIEAEEQANGKLGNRQKQLRHDLKRESFIQEPLIAKEKEISNDYQRKIEEFTAEHGEPQEREIRSIDKIAKAQAQKEFLSEIQRGGEPKGAGGVSKGIEQDQNYAGNINLNRLQNSDDAEKVIKETASLYKDKITEQTRGTITHEETSEMAKELGMSKDKLLKMRKGKALNAEEALAARDILKKETSKVVELQKKILDGDNSDEALDEFRRQIVAQANVQKAVSGETAEAGRALSAHKVIAKEERVAETTAKLTMRRKLEAESIQSLIAKATKFKTQGFGSNLGNVVHDPEATAAQIELLRRAGKAGAKSTAELTTFLVKAGLSDDVASQIVLAGTKATQTGGEFVQKKMTEALGDREITEDIVRRMSKIDLQDPIAVNRFIRGVTKAKKSDQVFTYFINSILSNPLTHIVNTSSNLARSVANPIYRAAGAAIESPKRLIGKEPGIYAGEATQEIFGKLAGMKEGARRFLFTMRNGVTEEQITKFDMRPAALTGKVGEALMTPTRALTAEDEFFKAINSQGELQALAYREAKKQGKNGAEFWRTVKELMDNPNGTMIEGATKAAERQTFQDSLGDVGNSYIRLRNKSFLKWITPFVKTPVNIAKDAVRTSPIGLVTAMRKSGTERSMEAGQAAVGSAASYFIAQQAMEGRLTGAAPRGEAEKKRFYSEGKKPYAIKIGDKWFEYRRIEPFATVIGIIADGNRLWQEKDLQDAQVGEIAAEAAKLIGQNAVDKTFMQGLNNLVNAIEEPDRYGERFLSSYASAAVPFSGAVRAASNAIDDTVRDPKNVVENIKSGLPWLSKTVRPKLDPFGEAAKKSSGAIERTLSPVQSSKESGDALVKELSRLDVTIPSAGKKQGGVKLTEDEYFDFMQKRGQKTRERLEKITNAPNWQYLDDDTKKRRLERYLDSGKANPKDVQRQAGERLQEEISSKLSGMETQEKKDYIVRLLEKKRISVKTARRLRRDNDL